MLFDTFYKDLKDCFEEKLITEISRGKRFSVCNMADMFYAVFPHVKSGKYQCGVIVNHENIKYLVEDEMFFKKIYSSMSKEEQKQLSFVLDEGVKELLRKYKAKTDLEGPSNDIEVELEEQLGARKNKENNYLDKGRSR